MHHTATVQGWCYLLWCVTYSPSLSHSHSTISSGHSLFYVTARHLVHISHTNSPSALHTLSCIIWRFVDLFSPVTLLVPHPAMEMEAENDDNLNETDPLPPYFPAIQGCRSVEEFVCINRVEEGTYGVVYRARDKRTGETVALKRLKMEKEREGFPITSLREISTLLKASHENIVTVREIVVGSNMDKIYLVMEFVEHDLKSLMESMKKPFLLGEVKTLLQQLLRAVAHLHDNWILHRDLKTSNLLLSHKGILKVCFYCLNKFKHFFINIQISNTGG